MENNKNKKSLKFQIDTLNFYDFIQVFVFTRNHHLNSNGRQDFQLSVKETADSFGKIGSQHATNSIVALKCHFVFAKRRRNLGTGLGYRYEVTTNNGNENKNRYPYNEVQF